MNNTPDLLQIKIEQARMKLPEATRDAIANVPWQASILKMRETKGYSFEQLGDLELETELLLCGLVSLADYPNELKTRMKISEAEVNELMGYMNQEVFSRIREELIKNSERGKRFEKNLPSPYHTESRGEIYKPINLQDELELPAPASTPSSPEIDVSILDKKLAGSFQVGAVKTEHTIDNITKKTIPVDANAKTKIPAIDPYREIPE